MSHLVDLRKVSIKSEQDVLDFLELFVTKAPQITKFIKDQRFKNASLQNRLNHALENQPQNVSNVDEDASVLERMTGGQRTKSTKTASESRIEQLRNAQSKAAEPTTKPVEKPVETVDELPPAPVAPGEIGQLHVPAVDPKVPNATTVGSELPEATGQPIGDVEEEVAQASGSKSEQPTDDAVQSETTTAEVIEDEETLSDEEKAILLGQASEADKESVGAKASRKGTVNKKKK